VDLVGDKICETQSGMSRRWIRILVGVVAVVGLLLSFLFQVQDVSIVMIEENSFWRFFVGRCIRLLVNDALAIALIYALFYERKFVMFAIWVQVLGVVFVVMPYFIIKFNFPHYNGPLVSFLHRLVLNPTLILLLIPAFYFQRRVGSK
jgi:exosortase F-associated protein